MCRLSGFRLVSGDLRKTVIHLSFEKSMCIPKPPRGRNTQKPARHPPVIQIQYTGFRENIQEHIGSLRIFLRLYWASTEKTGRLFWTCLDFSRQAYQYLGLLIKIDGVYFGLSGRMLSRPTVGSESKLVDFGNINPRPSVLNRDHGPSILNGLNSRSKALPSRAPQTKKAMAKGFWG